MTKSAQHAAAPPTLESSFEAEAGEVLLQLQTMLARLVRSLPGDIRRATHLQQVLGVDAALGWQIYRASTSENPLAAGRHLPGPTALARVFDAAQRLGVAAAVIEDVQHACVRFEALVERHAGDRDTFEALLSAISEDRDEHVEMKQRRAAFRACSRAWGVQARAHIVCVLVHPGRQPGTFDAASADGMVDVRALRRDVEIRLGHRVMERWDDGEYKPSLLADGDTGAARLMNEFCTEPLPRVLYRPASNGKLRAMITPHMLGARGAVTFFTRQFVRDMAAGDPLTACTASTFVTVPCKVEYIDMLLPRNWAEPSSLAMRTYACAHDPRDSMRAHPEDRMPAAGRAVFMGRGLNRLEVPACPKYPHLLERLLQDAGWNADDFDLYRARIDYPLLHTTSLMTIDQRVERD